MKKNDSYVFIYFNIIWKNGVDRRKYWEYKTLHAASVDDSIIPEKSIVTDYLYRDLD